MKMHFEIECTPEEARRFLGLPDVAAINDHLVSEMKRRLDSNAALLEPEALMRHWMSLGGQAQEQFRNLMTAAVGGARSGAGQG